jgi:hypothetical protein
MSNVRSQSELTDILTPLIDVLKEKNIAEIEPVHVKDDEVNVRVSLVPTESNNIYYKNKLFPWDSSDLLDYHYIRDNKNDEYNRIYTIINDKLKLDGLKIIYISRWNPSTLSIRIKKTTGGSGGKKKRSIKRRKSTKKNRHIKRNRHTKRR